MITRYTKVGGKSYVPAKEARTLSELATWLDKHDRTHPKWREYVMREKALWRIVYPTTGGACVIISRT